MKIPGVDTLEGRILRESKLDLTAQRMKMTKRLANLSAEKLAEIHLEEWYASFWKLASLAPYLPEAPEISSQLTTWITLYGAEEPARRQFFALALLMFGKLEMAYVLIDNNLIPNKLREDFETFIQWNKLTSEPDIRTRVAIAKNGQIKHFLLEKYSALVEKYAAASAEKCPRAKKFRIWYCWFQGEENLPPLVRCCYESLRRNSGRYEVCFVDEENFGEYVKLPEHILKKFAAGKISRTHLSDILRVNILAKHGGLWLDATILVTEPLERHRDLLERRYFTQKFYHEKRRDIPQIYRANPSYGRWATFAQGSAYEKYPLFEFLREFYEQYWADFDEVLDYVLMDFAMDIAYENIAAVRADMDAVPVNNPDANTLVFKLNEPYESSIYEKILARTFLHKLNWRVKLRDDLNGTVYREIRKKYLGE